MAAEVGAKNIIYDPFLRITTLRGIDHPFVIIPFDHT